ncbi:MAG: hypothetical protein K6A35_05640 [bacterium]|nr:hypothetical protein [bacterium]
MSFNLKLDLPKLLKLTCPRTRGGDPIKILQYFIDLCKEYNGIFRVEYNEEI